MDAFFIILLKLSQFQNNGKFWEGHLLTEIHVIVFCKLTTKLEFNKKGTSRFI